MIEMLIQHKNLFIYLFIFFSCSKNWKLKFFFSQKKSLNFNSTKKKLILWICIFQKYLIQKRKLCEFALRSNISLRLCLLPLCGQNRLANSAFCQLLTACIFMALNG